MQITKLVFVGIALVSLSACLDSDAERGVAGAAAGALVSDALGGNSTTGALIGGAAGVFCDDAGVCN